MTKKKNTKVSIERVCQTCAHFDKPSSMCKKAVEHIWASSLTRTSNTSQQNDKDMEEKTITIKMKGARPERRVLKSWKFWAFIACALLVAVCEAIDGNWIGVIWVIIAASFKFFADVFEEYSSDFYDLSCRLILEQEALQDALKDKDNKIAELQAEIISLKIRKTSKP